MSVLDRSALEASPLADLHAIASELGLDGFRRLRKADLVDAILARQEGNGGEPAEADVEAEPEAEADAEPEASEDADTDEADDQEEREERPARRRRGGRGRGRGRGRAEDEDAQREEPAAEEEPEERTVEGTVELLSNGSGFVRVAPPEPSDDDVYVSAAQVRRCELVAGDRVTGPVRRPRRSERYPSLIRVDTINGQPADEVAEGTRYDELPAGFPTERFELPGDDPNLQAVAWLTPFGRGSRVTIAGPARAGKTELLRRIAGALSSDGSLTVTLVLAGVRPEEVPEWEGGPGPAGGRGHALRLRRHAGADGRARRRAGAAHRRARRERRRARRLPRRAAPQPGPPGARLGPQPRRRRVADHRRHGDEAARRGDDGDRARSRSHRGAPLPGARPGGERDHATRAARGRGRGGGDRPRPRGGAGRLVTIVALSRL